MSAVIPITKNGAFINYSVLDSVYTPSQDTPPKTLEKVRQIENYFTLKALQIIGAFKQCKCCVNDKKNKRIIVPRFGIEEAIKKFNIKAEIRSQIKPGVDAVYTWHGTLTPNQALLVSHITSTYYTPEKVAAGKAGFILNLEAGQGKSYIAAWLISHVKKRAVIILHSTALIEQWAKVLRSALGGAVSIGYYYNKKKVLGEVMLIIINSALSAEFTFGETKYSAIEFYNMFGLAIYDECHMYANKNAARIFSVAQCCYMLGLSATPSENSDGFDKIVWWGLGPVLDAKTIPGYQSTVNSFKGEVRRIMYYGPPEYTELMRNEKTDMISTTATVSMICDDETRCRIIIEQITDLIGKGLYVFVFADRRDYLEKLRQQLHAHMKDDSASAIMTTDAEYIRIVGGDKSAKLDTAEMKSRVIFTTYQYMGTGKSIVKMNGLVLATPRKSKMEQYIKRIFRLGSDASISRCVVDIVDMRTPLKNQWYSRNKFYKSMNLTVIEEEYQVADETAD